MNLAVRKPMTLAEFLAWEERQPLRYEFDGIGPVAMTGGTFAHSAIQRNLAISVGGRLRGKPCQFAGSDFKIQVADGHIRYPDGMVVCSPVDREATVVHDPVVVFEVLSPSTAAIRPDRQGARISGDAVDPALCHAGAGQRRRNGVRPRRRRWAHDILVADSILALPEIGVELPLAELYEGIAFDDEPEAGEAPGG